MVSGGRRAFPPARLCGGAVRWASGRRSLEFLRLLCGETLGRCRLRANGSASTEISATVYYQLLERHVKDPAIRAMSRLILRDEAAHIAFHRERLVLPGVAGRRFYGRTWETWFRVLGRAAGTMLWINHRPALVASGATTMEFYGELWKQMTRFITRLRRELNARPFADLGLLGDFLDAK